MATARIQQVNSTMTTLTVRLTNLQSDYNGNLRVCNWQVNSKHYGYMPLQNQISSSQDYMIENLHPGKSYSIKVIVKAPGWADSTTIGPVNLSTDPFEWSSRALTAFNNKGLTTNLTASEWNEMVDVVQKLVPSWRGENAKVESGDPITASVFNEVAFTIACPTVQKGAPCLGSHFIDLADYINNF